MSGGNNLWLLNNANDGDYFGTNSKLVKYSSIKSGASDKMVTQSELGADPGSGKGTIKGKWYSAAGYAINRCVPANKIIFRIAGLTPGIKKYTVTFTSWNSSTMYGWNVFDNRPFINKNIKYPVKQSDSYSSFSNLHYVISATGNTSNCVSDKTYKAFYQVSAGSAWMQAGEFIFNTAVFNYTV